MRPRVTTCDARRATCGGGTLPSTSASPFVLMQLDCLIEAAKAFHAYVDRVQKEDNGLAETLAETGGLGELHKVGGGANRSLHGRGGRSMFRARFNVFIKTRV